MRTKRQPDILEDLLIVPLTKGFVAVIDALDSDKIMGFNWHVKEMRGRKYAARKALKSEGRLSVFVFMHREIIHADDGVDIDHIDGNGLNNCRNNLRLATRSQNIANTTKNSSNTSGYKGVFKSNRVKPWKAQIVVRGSCIFLGHFDSKEEAHTAYVKAAEESFGEYAKW